MKKRVPDARVAWLLFALPGLLQVFLLAVACAARLRYPLDLEWMEGGMLTHAARVADGRSLYAAPSVDFIPFLYTPLYPAVLAGLGEIFGLGYTLGRAVSLLSTGAILAFAAVAVTREAPPQDRFAARAAAVCAWGFFAAAYPWVECFYDLVRGDMLALALGTGGLVALRAWAARPRLVAVAAAVLALSFFAKQTGVLLVAAGGAALAVMHWRALPVYVATAGVVGLGGTWLYTRATGGWFWTYVYVVHQNHDTNEDRFWRSFDLILTHYPLMTAVVAAGLVAVAAHALARRRLPAGGAGFLYWTWLYACGTVIGAVGWATQWAVFNAFIPAMAFGAIAAGAAVVPLAAAAAELARHRLARPVAAGAALALLGAALLAARWDPRWSALVADNDARVKPPPPWRVAASVRPFVPTNQDRAAAAALVARLGQIEGPIFFPSHPWYPRLAGQRALFVHRIGVKDVTFELPCLNARSRTAVLGKGPGAVRVTYPCLRKGPPLPPEARVVAGLDTAMREQRFAAIVLDHGESPGDYPGMAGRYQRADTVPGPRVFSGKPTTPGVLYLPVPGLPTKPK